MLASLARTRSNSAVRRSRSEQGDQRPGRGRPCLQVESMLIGGNCLVGLVPLFHQAAFEQEAERHPRVVGLDLADQTGSLVEPGDTRWGTQPVAEQFRDAGQPPVGTARAADVFQCIDRGAEGRLVSRGDGEVH